jgi:hypothetical protein
MLSISMRADLAARARLCWLATTPLAWAKPRAENLEYHAHEVFR